MTRPFETWHGSCHCGAVRFEIDTDFPELTTCDCSICRRKNAVMVKVHETAFRLIAGADSLREYRFHTHTARHFFLRHLLLGCRLIATFCHVAFAANVSPGIIRIAGWLISALSRIGTGSRVWPKSAPYYRANHRVAGIVAVEL